MDIAVTGVSKQFNRRNIFSDVSFSVSTGEVFGITGKNGAGKSTLLRIIGGVLGASKGSVRYSRGDSDIPHEHVYRHVGYVAPYLTLYDEFSAVENIALYARIRGVALGTSGAQDLLARVGLPTDRKDPIRTYSSGMKQRMRLIFALVHAPEVLLLDEPVSNLDTDGMDVVYSIVEQQRERGCVVIATNDASDIARCDRTFDIPRAG